MNPARARRLLTSALDTLPLATEQGRLPSRVLNVPIQTRGVIPCWTYQHYESGHTLCLGFFRNFTDHDLICKVVKTGDELTVSVPASLQLNADECFFNGPEKSLEIRHHGVISPHGRPISRDRMVKAMHAVAPAAVELLGGLEPDRPGWQIWFGDTRNVGLLLDRLFAYCLGVEQVRRSVLKERSLTIPPIPKSIATAQLQWLYDEDFQAAEGRASLVLHRRKERSKKLVELKKRRAKSLACEVCGHLFSAKYPGIGDGFIECHHTIPVSRMKSGHQTKVSELVLVCSNCHRMLHRRVGDKYLSITQLQQLVRSATI